MTFVDILEVILPSFLYIAGIVLMIVFIILGIKLIKVVDKTNKIMDNVENKVNSLNGVFNVINYFNDKISYVTGIVVDKVSDIVMKIKNKEYNDDEEDL